MRLARALSALEIGLLRHHQHIGLAAQHLLHKARGDLQRVEDVLQYARDPLADGIPEFLDDDLREGPVKLAGHLEFRNVSFGYNPTWAQACVWANAGRLQRR